MCLFGTKGRIYPNKEQNEEIGIPVDRSKEEIIITQSQHFTVKDGQAANEEITF
jgi:hypothetical protein